MSIKSERPNCVVVLGPTASGKTTLACELALQLNGEIISADSRQVYKRLDIGTGKDLSAYNVKGTQIPYHLIDVAEPGEQFFLHEFTAALKHSFEGIRDRNHLPVICGGTGLYLDALRKDYSLTQIPEDHELREHLSSLDKDELLVKLSRYPEKHIAQVDKTSVKRVIRGIEIAEYLSRNRMPDVAPLPYRPFYLGIKPDERTLYSNIQKRLNQRFDQGMIAEVEELLQRGISHERLQALGLEYRFISKYLLNELTGNEMKDKLLIAIRQYAKRQMTWFRKMEKEGVRIEWLSTSVVDEKLIKELERFFS